MGRLDYDELFQTPTAVRLKKFMLFHDRYIYIDIKDGISEKVFKERGIRGRNIDMIEGSESDFVVIVRDIPKWQRKKVFSAMNKVKSKMFKYGYKDVHICGVAMMQYLKKANVRYSSKLDKKKAH